MTRRELLESMDSYEFSLWAAYFREANKKPEKPKPKHETLVGQLKNALGFRQKGKPLSEDR